MLPQLARRHDAEVRRVAAALILVLALAGVAFTAKQAVSHRQHARGHAILISSAADNVSPAPRVDQPVAVGTPSSTDVRLPAGVTADPSEAATSHTAQSPTARGPPGQAAA